MVISNESSKAKKLTKAPATHPSYSVMVAEAISAMKSRTGSSRKSIQKYIFANYEVDAAKSSQYINKAQKKGVEKGSLQMAAETGKKNAGKFKLVKVEKPKKKSSPEGQEGQDGQYQGRCQEGQDAQCQKGQDARC